jgi:hypothetical protein
MRPMPRYFFMEDDQAWFNDPQIIIVCNEAPRSSLLRLRSHFGCEGGGYGVIGEEKQMERADSEQTTLPA